MTFQWENRYARGMGRIPKAMAGPDGWWLGHIASACQLGVAL